MSGIGDYRSSIRYYFSHHKKAGQMALYDGLFVVTVVCLGMLLSALQNMPLVVLSLAAIVYFVGCFFSYVYFKYQLMHVLKTRIKIGMLRFALPVFLLIIIGIFIYMILSVLGFLIVQRQYVGRYGLVVLSLFFLLFYPYWHKVQTLVFSDRKPFAKAWYWLWEGLGNLALIYLLIFLFALLYGLVFFGLGWMLNSLVLAGTLDYSTANSYTVSFTILTLIVAYIIHSINRIYFTGDY